MRFIIGEGGWNNFPGDADVYDKTVGDLGTRKEMFAAFKKSATKRQKNKHFDN